MQENTISIIGLGKLGSPMAAAYASCGFSVIGVDANPVFVSLMAEGKPPVEETDLQEYLLANKERISATESVREAIFGSSLTFVIVPTPSKEDGSFSNEYLEQVCKRVGEALKEKNEFHVVVITSTVIPGSTERELKPLLEQYSGKKCGVDFGVCYNPEFIALGSVIQNLLHPDFILIGQGDNRSGTMLEKFYAKVCPGVVVKKMNIVNAEITKIALNTYVTTKISYANMLSELCEKVPGGNVDDVTGALGQDVRVGHRYLKGAMAYGGPCFPRDNRALAYTAKSLGIEVPIAQATDAINRHQIDRLTAKIMESLPEGGRVGFLGLAYKPDTNVIEESHPIHTIARLLEKRVPVVAYDPMANDNAKKLFGETVTFASSALECIRLADVIVIATPWKEFKDLSAADIQKEGRKIIIDCWRLLPDNFVRYVPLGHHVSR